MAGVEPQVYFAICQAGKYLKATLKSGLATLHYKVGIGSERCTIKGGYEYIIRYRVYTGYDLKRSLLYHRQYTTICEEGHQVFAAHTTQVGRPVVAVLLLFVSHDDHMCDRALSATSDLYDLAAHRGAVLYLRALLIEEDNIPGFYAITDFYHYLRYRRHTHKVSRLERKSRNVGFFYYQWCFTF